MLPADERTLFESARSCPSIVVPRVESPLTDRVVDREDEELVEDLEERPDVARSTAEEPHRLRPIRRDGSNLFDLPYIV
ncbi:hypothetical protein DEI92_13355 [Curtobacterium sp. MCBD17_034]|uniref:hypothetical protein n=1 Tax=unclassified Curtobacterium TaxID=257496 RepID=UPI000DA8B450|nr:MULTISPECIES: hypothetical protein [unclassified Curtobacterium]PZF57148.1 hypothetical protein DEI92_13355 [Curtobacterium sp. MCBD17_034]PZM33502.1 hypothetical protein DEI90_12445 [Curtobacterium sp. MCBD17_031]